MANMSSWKMAVAISFWRGHHDGLKHEQAEQVRRQLGFDDKATDFHFNRDRLPDAAMGLGQRLGTTGDVFLMAESSLFQPASAAETSSLFSALRYGVGLCFFKQREDFVTGQPNGLVRRASVADDQHFSASIAFGRVAR